MYVNKHLIFVSIFTILLSGIAGCGNDPATILLTINDAALEVEVARTTEEKSTGLMHRESMPADYGMLFVYTSDQRMSFYMANTYIPLSIAFISSDGIIREIRDMQPESLRTIVSRRSVRYALEVNQGIFEEIGAKVGDTVVFPADF
jgi:uncharacterized protein